MNWIRLPKKGGWALLTLVIATLLCAMASLYEKNVALLLLTATLCALIVMIVVPRLRDFFLIIASVMLALTIGEALLASMMNDRGTHFDRSSGFVNNYWQQGEIGPIPRAGQHSSHLLGPDDATIYDVLYTIGADGFRSTPDSDVKNPKQRINFFGDSYMFGEGLEDNETLTYFFSRQMQDTQVKNFGVSGYGVHQALALMQGQYDTKGDINFLLTAPWHAERSACVPSFTVGTPRYRLDNDNTLVRDGFCNGDAITKRSALVGLLKGSSVYSGTQSQRIELYLSIIKQMHALSKQRDQKFFVGFIKADEIYFNSEWSNLRIVSALQEAGIDVIDLTLAERNEELLPQYYLHELDKHPTGLANRERAKLLFEYLSASSSP